MPSPGKLDPIHVPFNLSSLASNIRMVVSEVVHPLPSHPQAILLMNFVARTPATGIEEEEEMTSNKSFVCMC
jgi:hypothetical protein